jgi:hypothetical protein
MDGDGGGGRGIHGLPVLGIKTVGRRDLMVTGLFFYNPGMSPDS